MADQPSIFENGNQQQETPASNNTPVQPGDSANLDPSIVTVLEGIKNERGEPKYKTLQDAMNALVHSQQYIPTLKQTLEQKEQELEAAKAEALRVKELERSLEELTRNPGGNPNKDTPPVVDEKTIADLINRTLAQNQKEATAKQNVEAVVSTMQEKFGNEAEAKFYAKAQELGMTADQFNQMAATSPKAVLNLLGLEGKKEQSATILPRGSINSDGFTPPNNSFIGRNTKAVPVGASYSELMEEGVNSKRMVEELHAAGKTVHDLTDPKEYMKFFGSKK